MGYIVFRINLNAKLLLNRYTLCCQNEDYPNQNKEKRTTGIVIKSPALLNKVN